MNLASSSKWFTKRKSSLTSNLPKSMSIREISKYLFLWTASHDNSSFQKKPNILQRYNKCSRDSSSSLQKVPKGDSMILNLYSFVFVKIMRFNNLYWNYLSFVSNVTSKAKEYLFPIHGEIRISIFKFSLGGLFMRSKLFV